MDRSKWANNPECFDDKGRWKKGARMHVRSKRYQALTLKRREREHRLAAEPKRSHGEPGGICIAPFWRGTSRMVVSMRSKRLMLGQVRKRSCERHRTDLNLREGRALPFPTSLLASERVARITVLNALARPGML
jgi:hypothetical protein